MINELNISTPTAIFTLRETPSCNKLDSRGKTGIENFFKRKESGQRWTRIAYLSFYTFGGTTLVTPRSRYCTINRTRYSILYTVWWYDPNSIPSTIFIKFSFIYNLELRPILLIR